MTRPLCRRTRGATSLNEKRAVLELPPRSTGWFAEKLQHGGRTASGQLREHAGLSTPCRRLCYRGAPPIPARCSSPAQPGWARYGHTCGHQKQPLPRNSPPSAHDEGDMQQPHPRLRGSTGYVERHGTVSRILLMTHHILPNLAKSC